MAKNDALEETFVTPLQHKNHLRPSHIRPQNPNHIVIYGGSLFPFQLFGSKIFTRVNITFLKKKNHVGNDKKINQKRRLKTKYNYRWIKTQAAYTKKFVSIM